MGAKIWVPLVLSVVLGLGAALLAAKVLHAPHASQAGAAAMVVVAGRDIDAGTKLTAADLTTIKYPPKEVPAGATTDMGQFLDRVTLTPLVKGQIPAGSMLAPAGTPDGLQSLVPVGLRAVTLEVNEFSGLGGMVLPGAHVDLIANIRDEKSHDSATRTIVQNVKVLAVGRQLGSPAPANSGNPAPAANNVTLLVTPKEAQAIQLASQNGRPWLALRGFHDQKNVDPGTTSLSELRGESDQVADTRPVEHEPAPAPTTQPVVQPAAQVAAARPADPPQKTVRLILGSEEQRVTFTVEPEPSQTTTTDKSDAIPQ